MGKRISQDYLATEERWCNLCGSKILPGMKVFDFEIREGLVDTYHSEEEPEIYKQQMIELREELGNPPKWPIVLLDDDNKAWKPLWDRLLKEAEK